jgi:monovalent cation/hydrogen antiporter
MSLDLQQGIVALSLIVAVAAMLALAPRLRIPFPILLVLGGLAIGIVPGMPEVELNPKLIFFGVLPPLLYGAAFFTSLRDLRANKRTIGLLAIGLVIATTVGVAVVAHTFVDGLTWKSAFVLGAIVSPTDPIAATAIARRLSVPRKLIAIVEGESLVNDGSGLVLYRVAVAAVVAGSFSVAHAGWLFVASAAGGIALGLGVGWVVRQVRRRLDNPPAEVTISLLTGYLAFIPADLIGVSAVLAAVTAGIYLGWHTPELTTPQVRLQGLAVWEIVQYLLNALLFVLIGLQLPVVVDALGDIPNRTLLAYAALVSATVIVVRFAWVFAVINVPKWIVRRMSGWRGGVFISWSGMRGAVSLAAALALPLTTNAGQPFPGRNLIVFLTFAVILVTLVAQGLTLPLVIRALGLEDDGADAHEEAKARIRASEAALARLEELLDEEWVREDTAERMRGSYRFRSDRFRARFDGGDDGSIEARSQDYQRLRRELLDAERGAVLELRRTGVISDDVWYRVARDLDLEDQRLDI